jgi:hypothetical protein
MPAGAVDGGGIPEALADEQPVFVGLEGAERVLEAEAFGRVFGPPMVRVHSIAHEQDRHAARGGFLRGGFGSPGLEGLHPRQAEGDPDASEEVAAGEGGVVGVHGEEEQLSGVEKSFLRAYGVSGSWRFLNWGL